MEHHISISLMLFKPSHTYAALDLTTDSHYHEQEPQLPPRLSSFRITLLPGIINLKQMVVLLKIIESQGAPVWCGPGEVSCTSRCPGKASPWDQTWLLKGLQSQGLKPLKGGDSPNSLGPSSTAWLSPWGKDFPNQLFILQRLSEHCHARKAFMGTEKQDISLSSKANNMISKNP